MRAMHPPPGMRQALVDAEGRPYHLVLLDSEGIDAYDQVRCHGRGAGLYCLKVTWPAGSPRPRPAAPRSQRPLCPKPRAQTAQYSTQIFSLAVLLSSCFVYNQMGGIDEAALDRCVWGCGSHGREAASHGDRARQSEGGAARCLNRLSKVDQRE